MTVDDQEEEADTQAEETTSNNQSAAQTFSNVTQNNAAREPKPLTRSERLITAPLKLKDFVVTKK